MRKSVMRKNVHRQLRCTCVGVTLVSVAFCLTLAFGCSSALALNEHSYTTSFAGPGSGSGQLSGPTAIAVNDTTHDVYVADTNDNRVEEFSPFGSFIREWSINEPVYIAIDNSTDPSDPSAGDVYVVPLLVQPGYLRHDRISPEAEKFTANGEYLGSIFVGGGDGIAVDPKGEVWTTSSNAATNYTDELINKEIGSEYNVEGRLAIGRAPNELGLLAVDDSDSFYAARHGGEITESEIFGEAEGVYKFNSQMAVLNRGLDPEKVTTGLAVESPSGTVYVDNVDRIAGFKSSGEPLPQPSFGEGHITQGGSIAVDSSTGTVYVIDEASDEVHVFNAIVVPDVETDAALELQVEGRATLGGAVDPDGEVVTACYFEYGPSMAYGQTMPCSSSPSGDGPVQVSAKVTGLTPGTVYHYRLVAADANGSNPGEDRTFIAPAAPSISEESVLDVASGSATLEANVNAGGADTAYRFEYGTTSSYGESLPVGEGDAGSGLTDVSVSVHPQDLLPLTLYHYRIVVGNMVRGEVAGEDQTFTTQSTGGEFALPDGRAYELVSPPNKNGAVIQPVEERGGLVQASEEGSAITYLSEDPLVLEAPSNTNETQTLSRRATMGGWSSADISTRHETPTERSVGKGQEYRFFSSDLSRGVVEPLGETQLAPEALAPSWQSNNGQALYVSADQEGGPYEPLLRTSNVAPMVKFGDAKFLGASSDLGHIVFSSPEALTAKAGSKDLYEWAEGQLQLVDVLPNKRIATEEGGAVALGLGNNEVRNAVSDDGSRVFWTDTTPAGKPLRHLYVRDIVTKRTTQVDAAQGVKEPLEADARFAMASTDGSRVFFTDTQKLTPESSPSGVDLYEFDVETGDLRDLTVDHNVGEAASVLGVVGASEDGSYVYFVANGVLAPGGTHGDCQEHSAPGAVCNLYVSHEHATQFIATLSAEDKDWPDTYGDGLTSTTSRVSPNGRYVAFMSDRSLTGYDNLDANSGEPDEEVYLYDAASSRLACASCNPTGARPVGMLDNSRNLIDYPRIWGGRWLAASIPGWTPMNLGLAQYQSRYLSDDGRLFFDSEDGIVPQDTNGLEDVYEYEPEGVGSCTMTSGCVSLITPGTSGEESAFLDASAGGDDVFFLTDAKLLPEDQDTAFDVYDAHVCSMAEPCPTTSAGTPPCTTADSCRTAPLPQPSIFGEPSSATFSGSGNVAPQPAKAVVKAKKAKRPKRKASTKRKAGKRPKKKVGKRPKPKGKPSRIARAKTKTKTKTRGEG